MKKLMEGWNRFLKENQEEEILDDIKNITNQKMKYAKIDWQDYYDFNTQFFIRDERGNWVQDEEGAPIFLFSAWAIIDPMSEFKIDPKSIDDGYLLNNEVRSVFEKQLSPNADIGDIGINNGTLFATLDFSHYMNSLSDEYLDGVMRQLSRPEENFKKLAEDVLAVDDLLQDPDFKNKLFTTLNRAVNSRGQ